MNTQHNYMKPSPQAEAAKDTHPATLGADDGVRSTHTTCGDCEYVSNHSALDTPAGPGAQDWEHWEWTGGDMRLVLTMQQRRWNDTHVGYHKDMDYERGAGMVAAAYTPDDTTAGRWVLVGMWVVRNPTPDSVQQFISRWSDDGIQLASSAIRSRYDYPVFFDRVLFSWDDTVKAISHAIQGEGWRVDWEWDFNRGADGRVVLTNTKDKSAPALVFIDPARCHQTGAGVSVKVGADPVGGGAWEASATVGKDTGVDVGLSAGSSDTHGGSEATITAAARRAFSGAGTVRGHTPAQELTPGAPGTHGGGGSDDGPVGVSYGVPDSGFTPIVYVDYNHQEQDWFEVYGPDYTDDEGELLPDVAAAARHSIPDDGGVFPVSPGSFLQVIDVVKWWLGVDDNISTDALGTLRHAMKGKPALGD